jgi:hypothetical protein
VRKLGSLDVGESLRKLNSLDEGASLRKLGSPDEGASPRKLGSPEAPGEKKEEVEALCATYRSFDRNEDLDLDCEGLQVPLHRRRGCS